MEHSTLNMAITSGLYKAVDTRWRQAEESSFCEFHILGLFGREINSLKKINHTIICQTRKWTLLTSSYKTMNSYHNTYERTISN